ncbi:DUF2080 family transposase-associated protein [Thermogutta sp.]
MKPVGNSGRFTIPRSHRGKNGGQSCGSRGL